MAKKRSLCYKCCDWYYYSLSCVGKELLVTCFFLIKLKIKIHCDYLIWSLVVIVIKLSVCIAYDAYDYELNT